MTNITPSKLIDNLKEKIKVEFVNLVPEKEWDKLLKETVQDFKEKELKNVITEELKIHYQKEIKKYLTEKATSQWDSVAQKNVLDKGLENMIVAMAPEILKALMAESIRDAIYNMQQQNRY